MFVWSMKTTRPRLATFGVVLALLVAVMAVGRKTVPVGRASADGADALRMSYLQRQGYTVDPQWTDVREVVASVTDPVPATYRGKRIRCFTYATEGGGTVCLYECNGTIIGTKEQGNDYGAIG